MIRDAIRKVGQLGPFPSEGDTTEEQVAAYAELLLAIERPVSNDEAELLCSLLGDDTYFGLAWTALHLIETAPGWPIRDAVQQASDEWREILEQRIENASLR
jgi:hypothetical protein